MKKKNLKNNPHSHLYNVIAKATRNWHVLTEPVLWNLIDYMKYPEPWENLHMEVGTASARGSIFVHAVYEFGLLNTFRRVMECYSLKECLNARLNPCICNIIAKATCNWHVLTESVLWNLIDLFADPEDWWDVFEVTSVDVARGPIFAHAVMELGLWQTLSTVWDFYRLKCA